jgi:hypothetical protein
MQNGCDLKGPVVRSLFVAAFAYLIAGAAAGVHYRELTKFAEFPEGGSTQLSVVHTHLLTLGFIFLLIVLVLDKVFALSGTPLFRWFFWLFNAGLVISTAMMIWHGTLTVLGQPSSAAIAGIAGMGHIVLTGSLIVLMVALGRRLPRREVRPAAAE